MQEKMLHRAVRCIFREMCYNRTGKTGERRNGICYGYFLHSVSWISPS